MSDVSLPMACRCCSDICAFVSSGIMAQSYDPPCVVMETLLSFTVQYGFVNDGKVAETEGHMK